MRKNIIIAAIAAASAVLLTVSCAKQEQPGLSNEVKTFTAVIDQGITKTTIDDYKVKWVSGDEISINGAVYSATPDGTDATKAGFAYKSGTTPSSPYSAIYPASLYNAGSLDFPEVQTYEAGKFNAPMYAESTTESLSFKNICGVICFGLKGTSKVKSIAITANEAICGAFTMTDATTVSLTGTGKTVTLDCGDGVQLGTESTNFYIYLPPKTYSAGMKIVITDTDGGTFTQSTTSEVVIKRNELYTLNWTPAFTPAGALTGKFSVGAGKQIQFSKGNLQATYDGSKYTWGFAANQYDYIGNAAGNTTIGSQTSGAVVDLFGWSTSATNFGINTSSSSSDYSGDFKDWGTAIDGNGTWRTLSTAEWQYLINKNNDETIRKGKYKYGVTVCEKANCLILAPDDFTGTIETSYNAAAWATAEAAGLVCLPAAGYRSGSDVLYVGGSGYYWSSTAGGSDYAFSVYFNSFDVSPDDCDSRDYGFSVRLITESK